jgi:hypothetical protein
MAIAAPELRPAPVTMAALPRKSNDNPGICPHFPRYKIIDTAHFNMHSDYIEQNPDCMKHVFGEVDDAV